MSGSLKEGTCCSPWLPRRRRSTPAGSAEKRKTRARPRGMVAKIPWHVPIFMDVSAGVTRDSSPSSRSSSENAPRLTPAERYFLRPPFLRGCLLEQTRHQRRDAVREKSAFGKSRLEMIVSDTCSTLRPSTCPLEIKILPFS